MTSKASKFLIALAAALLAVRPAHAQAPTDPSLRAFLVEFEEATSRFMNGDPTRWKQLLSSRDDATILGAWGGYEKGQAEVGPRFEWASGRLADIGGKVKVEYLSSGVSGDLAYTVAIERGEVRRADQDQPFKVEQRATNIFRKENGAWKLLHHHSDLLAPSMALPPGVASATGPPLAAGKTPVAQSAIPTLKYDPPANFYKSASMPPEQYFSKEVNANLQIYPFRPYTGDIVEQFQRTLLRDWIDPQYQEGPPPQPPTLTRQAMSGAQAVVTARFLQGDAAPPVERMRILIVTPGAAALVDLYANSAFSWQRAGPAMLAMLGTMRVETATVEPALPPGPATAAGRGLAGVYMGQKGHYVVDLNGAVGSGHWLIQPHFYLFSAAGRVYRTFDPTAAGDVAKFDFDAALRTDPESSGRYTVQGDQLILRMSGPQLEVITTALPKGSSVIIDKVTYLRQ